MSQPQAQLLGAIHPTLFIGLGGTGKEVLLRLRRKFYEQLGRPGLPCTSYLWIDTDTRDVMAQGEKVDEIFQSVAFKPHEQVGLLEGSVGGDLAGMFTNRGQWGHIHEWLHPEVERYGAEIADGAGGVRAVGRLTFFYRFEDRVKKLVRDALDTISTHEAINETVKLFEARKMGKVQFTDTPAPQVFVVCSLAGGTGCGTVLDTIFFLRSLKQEGVPIERFIGILFMPNVFYGNAQGEVAQRSYGNAYAALKELEFYTLRLNSQQDLGIDYHVEWDKGQQRRIQGPPFNIAYIQEMKNEGGVGLEPSNRAEVFSMVAESLMLDFMPSQFSTAKRSHYSNVVQYLSGVQGANITSDGVVLPQQFARRYASFGMSKIEIPVESLKGAAAAKLAAEILGYANRDASDPEIMTNVRTDMAQRQLDADGLEDRFTAAWKESIRNALAAITRSTVVKETVQVGELEARLREFEERQVSTRGTDPTMWGAAIDIIRKTTERVKREVNEALLVWLTDALEKDSRGLKSVIAEDGYLRYLSENLRALYAPRGEDAPAAFDEMRAAAEADAEYYQGRRDSLLRELRAGVKSFGVLSLAAREWTVDKLLERLWKAEEQYALARAAAVLYEETKKVAESAVKFLAQRRPVLESFQAGVAAMAKSYEARYREMVSPGEQKLFIRFYDEESDWDEFYKLGRGENGEALAVNPRGEYGRFLGHALGGGATLMGLAELFGRQGERETRRRLSAYTEERFWSDFEAHPRQIDVLLHPKLRDQEDESVARLVRSARPLIRRDDKLGGRSLEVERRAYLGISKDEGSPYAEFVEKVKQRLVSLGYAAKDIQVRETDKPWEVYLYLITYAFPLASLPIVTTECHGAYFSFYKALREDQIGDRKYHIPLHLSAGWEGKFDDLMVYKDSEARAVREARDVLLFGAVLKVLSVSVVQGRVEYGYKLGAPSFKTVNLGPRREAIESLRNDETLRTRLLAAVRQRESDLTKEQLFTYYWVLQYLKFSGEFNPASPEAKLLEDRIEGVHGKPGLTDVDGIHERLIRDHTIPESELELEGATEQENADLARQKAGAGREVVGGVSVLAGLDLWKMPAR
jgi:hypothetical protein